MTSPAKICSRALSRLGENSITSLDAKGKEARVASLHYDGVRTAVFREFVFNCTKTRAVLAADTAKTVFGDLYRYRMPTDCVRVLSVYETDEWKVEGEYIVCDVPLKIGIHYLKDEQNPALWDSLAQKIIVLEMALVMCEDFTQSNTKIQIIERELKDAKDSAVSADGQENTPDKHEPDEWEQDYL